MRLSTLRAAIPALLAFSPVSVAAQQGLYPQPAAMTGIEMRQYNFGSELSGLDHIRQVAVPLAFAVPLGRRASFDAGTWYASTNVAGGGNSTTFSGLTDTQLRLAYTLGNDALVASVMVNLPTGKQATTGNVGISSSVSSNFLLFPVNTYRTGTSVTPGLAAAATVGGWNVGLAGSVRWSAEYSPFSDSAGKYQPGVEGRIRVGADKLMGRSRFTVGGTYSTFANDELSGASFGGTSTTFDPGNRFLVEAGLASPVGNGSVSLYAWNYHRTSSNATSGKENVFTAGVAGSFPMGTKASFEPLAEARLWSPQSGSGSLFGAGAGVRMQLSPHFSFVPSARADVGSIKVTDSAKSASIFGFSLSGLLRYSF